MPPCIVTSRIDSLLLSGGSQDLTQVVRLGSKYFYH